MSSLSTVQQSFQGALHSYDENAFVQKNIAQHLLKLAQDAGLNHKLNRVLEVGCGTGLLTKQLLKKLEIQRLYSNDLVQECEQYIQPILPKMSQWQFIKGDIENVDIPSKLDLICSASTVQWVNDLSGLLRRFTVSLNHNGVLMVSSFSDQHFIEIQTVKQRLSCDIDYQVKAMNYWNESQWKQALQKNYEIINIESQLAPVYFNSFKALLIHLKRTGVSGNANRTWTNVTWNEFVTQYKAMFEQDGKIRLSYHPIYIIARKKR